MPGTCRAVGVRENLIAPLLAQSEGDREEVGSRLFPGIYRESRRQHDLSCSENALVFHVSDRTPKRDWSMATTWLKRELSVQP